MNINEATMSVNIAGVPRPFRIITKDQGKKEYGAPFYEEVTKNMKTLAEKMRAEKPDTRTARSWVKGAFEQLGVEPSQKAGFLTQLMRYKDAAALADDLYDIVVGADGEIDAVVGEEALNDKQSFSEAWDKQSEDEHASYLTKAGYDGEELSAYKKFKWDGLPPAVRTRVEVVIETYNPGAANIRLPFHADNLPKAEPTEKPEPEEEPEEKPADEEPAAEEPAAEEPEEEPAGEEEPKDAIFETQAAYTEYFRKMAGLAEAEPSGGEVPPSEPNQLDPDKPKDDPKLLDLIAKAQAGDQKAGWDIVLKFDNAIRKAANAAAAKRGLGDEDADDLYGAGVEYVFSDVIPKFDPARGVKFITFLTTQLMGIRNWARSMKREKNRVVSIDKEKKGDGDGKSSLSASLAAAVVLQADSLPPACRTALRAAIEALPDVPVDKAGEGIGGMRTAFKLAVGLDDKLALKLDPKAAEQDFRLTLRTIAPFLGVSHAWVAKLVKKAFDTLIDTEALKVCWDAASSGTVDDPDSIKSLTKVRKHAGGSDDDTELNEAFDPDMDISKFLDPELVAVLQENDADEVLEYPSDMVAEGVEALLLAEGVKIRRKGKKITIPVNEYGRAKRAFEKSGLTMPKKYVSHEADNIRKAARFSGQYGGPVLDKPF